MNKVKIMRSSLIVYSQKCAKLRDGSRIQGKRLALCVYWLVEEMDMELCLSICTQMYGDGKHVLIASYGNDSIGQW
jgi:hypothetical protein